MLVVGIAIAIGATATIVGLPGVQQNVGAVLSPDDAEIVARGEAVYVAHCALCHGRNLEGQPNWQTRDKEGFLPAPPHDESGHTWHHPDRLLFDITKVGVALAANLKGYKTSDAGLWRNPERRPYHCGPVLHQIQVAGRSAPSSR